ncbi:MAG: hypothetical protein WCJ18_08820 [Planctomycetota bacterium]
MAVKRASVVQSLSIALIVFVMLTFVLAVTTYLFFKEKFDAVEAVRNAETKMAEATTAEAKAREELTALQQVVGIAGAEAATGSDLQSKLNEEFGDIEEEKRHFTGVVAALKESLAKVSDDLKKAEADKLEAEKSKQEALEAAAKQRTELENQVKAKEAAAVELKQQFDEDRAKHEELSKRLAEKQKEALARSERLDLLVAEIAKGESLLPPARQPRFKAGEAEGRVGLLFDELRDREKQIAQQNTLLSELRVADKSLQETVLAATPKDDRIDGFDGRILSVNEADRSVLIDVGSTQGLRPGLVLKVYEPGDERPQAAASKAVVEVVAVESGALARARIRQASIRDPILEGDRVATSLWKPRTTFEAVIVGFVQMDGDETSDQDRLQELIERVGGRVEQMVSSSTTMIVDAGPPRTIGAGTERATGWRPADETRRDRQLKEARRLGIRIVGLDAFLEMLGLDRDSLDSNRLIRVGEPTASPARSDGVAY